MTLKSKVRDDAELSGKEDQDRWRREVEEAETRGVRLEHKKGGEQWKSCMGKSWTAMCVPRL